MTAYAKLSLFVTGDRALGWAEAIEAWDEPAALAVTAFEDRGPEGWVVDAYFDSTVTERELAAALDAQGDALGGLPRWHYSSVADEDWTAKVQRDLAPVRAGRFIIHGSHDRQKVRPARWAIEIDAGEAFGTAHHATTRGCLAAIEQLARVRGFSNVADVGCGTGVLAAAAAKAWPAARIVASDNDPIATRIARENARLNGVSGHIRSVTAAGLSHCALRRRAPYDLILANILAPPLIMLAPVFAAALASGGVIVLSGLLTMQARTVTGAYAARGFRRLSRRDDGDWTTLVLSRKAALRPLHRTGGAKSRAY